MTLERIKLWSQILLLVALPVCMILVLLDKYTLDTLDIIIVFTLAMNGVASNMDPNIKKK